MGMTVGNSYREVHPGVLRGSTPGDLTITKSCLQRVTVGQPLMIRVDVKYSGPEPRFLDRLFREERVEVMDSPPPGGLIQGGVNLRDSAGNSSTTEWSGGRVNVSDSLTWGNNQRFSLEYTVVYLEPGRILVPPALVEYRGRIYQSQTFWIEVMGESAETKALSGVPPIAEREEATSLSPVEQPIGVRDERAPDEKFRFLAEFTDMGTEVTVDVGKLRSKLEYLLIEPVVRRAPGTQRWGNPILVGKSGLGKRHWLHSTGRELLAKGVEVKQIAASAVSEADDTVPAIKEMFQYLLSCARRGNRAVAIVEDVGTLLPPDPYRLGRALRAWSDGFDKIQDKTGVAVIASADSEDSLPAELLRPKMFYPTIELEHLRREELKELFMRLLQESWTNVTEIDYDKILDEIPEDSQFTPSNVRAIVDIARRATFQLETAEAKPKPSGLFRRAKKEKLERPVTTDEIVAAIRDLKRAKTGQA